MTSFAPGNERFTVAHGGLQSTSIDQVAVLVIDAQYYGAEIDVTTTGVISNVGAVSLSSRFNFVRSGDSGGAVVYGAKMTAISSLSSNGSPGSHGVTQQGNNLVITYSFAAGATGSVFTHYVTTKGDKVRIRAL